jgi:hypothetical protein
MRQGFFSVVTVAILYTAFAEPARAQNPRQETRCQSVGGSIMTNFLTQTGTQGTATGDLKGSVVATVLSMTGPQANGQQTFTVRHTMVTESGDVLETDPSNALVTPVHPNSPLQVVGIYYETMKISRGTGKFQGATGSVRVIGAADFKTGETIFRYTGQVCLVAPVVQ